MDIWVIPWLGPLLACILISCPESAFSPLARRILTEPVWVVAGIGLIPYMLYKPERPALSLALTTFIISSFFSGANLSGIQILNFYLGMAQILAILYLSQHLNTGHWLLCLIICLDWMLSGYSILFFNRAPLIHLTAFSSINPGPFFYGFAGSLILAALWFRARRPKQVKPQP